MDSHQDIIIGPLEKEIGDICLDQDGLRILILSSDGIQLQMYATLR